MQRFLCRQHRSEYVRVEFAVEFGFGDTLDRLERVDAGVVHNDIEAVERLVQRRKDALDVGRFRNVALNRRRPSAGGHDRTDVCIRGGRVGDVVDAHRGSGRGEGTCDGGADAFRGAGDEGDFTCKIIHGPRLTC